MKVFKFGGASVKSSDAIRNMASIIRNHQDEDLVVVVSAMGKTTNALEEILSLRLIEDDFQVRLKKLESYHLEICHDLFEIPDSIDLVVTSYFQKINHYLSETGLPGYDQIYDRVVSIGEDLSSAITSRYLNESGISCLLLDARLCIKTDSLFREAAVNWPQTCDAIRKSLAAVKPGNIVLTQGFIGSDQEDRPTTLGREGSDFTAAIFASCLNASSVTIWKDVPGILNGDPKIIPETVLFKELPYNEASEMTFYGASVIHPKTIKPLANKKIPLLVKPFDNPQALGTVIHDCQVDHLPPTIIIKHRQCLFSLKVIDFTFVNEDNMSEIFKALHQLNISINIMQNSAISFSICFDYHPEKVQALHHMLEEQFRCFYNRDLALITIKNYDQEAINRFTSGKNILLEQKSRRNYRCLVSEQDVHEF